MRQSVERSWYRNSGWLVLLWPLSLLFRLLTSMRRRYYSSVTRKPAPSVPVIVVGNLSVGGTGKTPLLIGLARWLQKSGLQPGVISRGYLGKAPCYPFKVESDSPVEHAGDEALMIAQALDCPVIVDPNRFRALQTICADSDCDVILSDDGLQHYALPRDLEIAVVDGDRLFGNGFCLPAGPLREPVSRLHSVSYVVVNGGEAQGDDCRHPAGLASSFPMSLKPTYLVNVRDGQKKPFRGAPFNIGSRIHAVTGIGNPERFFTLLEQLPYEVKRHEFPDHHPFSAADFAALRIEERQPIVMTEKDAVKCRQFAGANFWYLAVEVEIPEAFKLRLLQEVQELLARRKASGQ